MCEYCCSTQLPHPHLYLTVPPHSRFCMYLYHCPLSEPFFSLCDRQPSHARFCAFKTFHILEPALELFLSQFTTAITTTGYLFSQSVTCFGYSCTGCFCNLCTDSPSGLPGVVIASICFSSAVFFSAVSCALFLRLVCFVAYR